MARYAYMRLDAGDPDTTRQAALLDGIGEFDRIFVDRALNHAGTGGANAGGAGALKGDADRLDAGVAGMRGAGTMPQLAKAVAALRPGDCLFAASADRVCGRIRDFVGLVDAVRQAGADFVCLDISFDTRAASSAQTLKALRTLSDIERASMSESKKSGIRSARSMGRRIGRPPVSMPAGFRDICRAWAEGSITGVEAIRRSGMKSTSFYKKAGELGYIRRSSRT